MRVAFINSLYAPFATGGAEATLQGLAEGLVARGWTADVICLTPRSQPHRDILGGVQVHYEPAPTVMWPFDLHQPPWRKALFQLIEAYNPVAAARVRARLQALRPDVVHVHNFKGFSASVWRAAAALDLPVVQTLHDYTLVCPRSVMFKAGRNCSRQCGDCRLLSTPRRLSRQIPHAYTAVSRRMVERMAACDAFPASAAPVVIHGDNPAVEGRARDLPRGSPLTFGFLGRLDPMKGAETLIAAAGRDGLQDVQVLIAGTGAPGYEAILREAGGTAENIDFLGHVDPRTFFDRIDVLVVPSIWEEPLGRVVHEALAYGRPVIASRIGGIPEIVEQGATGFLFEAGDIGALAEAMREANADPDRIRAMASRCRLAAADFERPLILDQYEQVLIMAAGRAATLAPAARYEAAA